ncbi:GNAT family N-acetyltransferase [Sutcliffiella sp. NPDC057660]|uniref:GNAT family N-acetyltransferase n=1 Tax=Sutcliffiella sp. NPDC057660 TaxID=3346199 RepID=UPI0036A2988E
MKDSKPVGFVIGKHWPHSHLNYHPGSDVGWISLLLVSKEFQGQGIGSKLLKKAEAALENLGTKTIHLGRDVQHFFPGVPSGYEAVIQWFEKRGYQTGDTPFDMIQSIYNMPTESTAPSLEIRRGRHGEEECIVHFLSEVFPGRWEYEARSRFVQGVTAEDYIVMRHQEEIVGFCKMNRPTDKVIGSNVYWSKMFPDKIVGGIGPLGISREVRKSGLGLALVRTAMEELQKNGVNQIIIDWTTLDEFYGKLGFTPWKHYTHMSK